MALAFLMALGVVLSGSFVGRTADRAGVTLPTAAWEPRVQGSGGETATGVTPLVGAAQGDRSGAIATTSDVEALTLQANPLYGVEVPAITSCPQPTTARTMAELERETRDQMTCVQDAWRPRLELSGYDSHEIPVYFFTGTSVRTPCGEVSGPAVYCASRGGAVYFGENSLRGTNWYPLGVKGLVGHEYGHHLQALAGIFHVALGRDTPESARRLELQATCFAYAMIARDDSVELTDDLYEASERFLRSVVEDDVHGSKESVVTWGERGLYSEVMGDCNTWVADAESVS